VHNTGVDGSDVVQPIGSPTSFWTLLSEPAGASEAIGSTPFRFNAGYYADNSVSGWVSPTAGGSAGVNGFYVYQMIVDLTGFDPNTAVITGTFGTDNDGSISVNGNPPAATACFACFSSPTGFTLNSGFVAGLNSIQLAMDNGGDPSAFRVEFARATADVATSGVPEPGSFPLIVGGLSALALLRRKFRRQTEKVTA
jgi:hypothetical protein